MKAYKKLNSWTEYWPDIFSTMYASDIYYPVGEPRGEFSRDLNDSKEGDLSARFEEEYLHLIKHLVEEDGMECACLIPNSQNAYSPTMRSLAEKVRETCSIPVLECLKWTAEREPRRNDNSSSEERAESTKGAMTCEEPIRHGRIILLDDLRVTGMTALEAHRALLERAEQGLYVLHAAIGMLRDKKGGYEEIEI